MPNRQWLLRLNDAALDELNSIQDDRIHDSIINAIEDLLCSINPLRANHVRNIKGRPGVWRRRVGRWRVLFELNSTPVKRGDIQYRGTLIVVAVSLRDEGTYR